MATESPPGKVHPEQCFDRRFVSANALPGGDSVATWINADWLNGSHWRRLNPQRQHKLAALLRPKPASAHRLILAKRSHSL
jgi:hypothetical protein